MLSPFMPAKVVQAENNAKFYLSIVEAQPTLPDQREETVVQVMDRTIRIHSFFIPRRSLPKPQATVVQAENNAKF